MFNKNKKRIDDLTSSVVRLQGWAKDKIDSEFRIATRDYVDKTITGYKNQVQDLQKQINSGKDELKKLEKDIAMLKNPYLFEIGAKVKVGDRSGVVVYRDYEIIDVATFSQMYRENTYTVYFGSESAKTIEKHIQAK